MSPEGASAERSGSPESPPLRGSVAIGGSADASPSRGKRPWVSVVVASCRDRGLLESCLASLLPQCRPRGVQVTVARAGDTAELEELTSSYPDVAFIPAPPGATIPELRAVGLAASEGDIVALTEDHCVVGPEWLARLVQAHEGGADVVGGAMDNAQRRRAVDWAAFFAEYGFFAERGGADREEPLLTGANVSYGRRVVARVIESARRGEWEHVIHSDLGAAGSALQFLRTAAVYQNRNYRFLDFCRDRFEHGRDYARRRILDVGPGRRWLYLACSWMLPALLTYRVSRAVAGRHRRPFLRAMPLTVAFLTAWSLGEAVGYALGPLPAGGASHDDRVEGGAEPESEVQDVAS